MHTYVILHNVRSAHNVGSIFRSADGAGVEKIFLVGYTPAPRDRFGRTNVEIEKTSLGATTSVLWEARATMEEVLEELRAGGISVIAVEQHPRSIAYREAHIPEHRALIFGNEVDGVPNDVCEAADVVWHIPMHGMKESLNVSVAAGIIMFHVEGR